MIFTVQSLIACGATLTLSDAIKNLDCVSDCVSDDADKNNDTKSTTWMVIDSELGASEAKQFAAT